MTNTTTTDQGPDFDFEVDGYDDVMTPACSKVRTSVMLSCRSVSSREVSGSSRVPRQFSTSWSDKGLEITLADGSVFQVTIVRAR